MTELRFCENVLKFKIIILKNYKTTCNLSTIKHALNTIHPARASRQAHIHAVDEYGFNAAAPAETRQVTAEAPSTRISRDWKKYFI